MNMEKKRFSNRSAFYTTSKDYAHLQGLLDSGATVVVFVDNDISKDCSYVFQNVCLACKDGGYYSFGVQGTCFMTWYKDLSYSFEDICKAYNVEYLEPNNNIIKKMEIKCEILCRYPEDNDINGEQDSETEPKLPCLSFSDGEWYWKPSIDAQTGQITNWEAGTTASISIKACDACGLKIYDNGKKIYDKEYYVPDFLSPREEGYGDYVYMDIDANGNIQGWDAVKVSDFLNAEK